MTIIHASRRFRLDSLRGVLLSVFLGSLDSGGVGPSGTVRVMVMPDAGVVRVRMRHSMWRRANVSERMRVQARVRGKMRVDRVHVRLTRG